MRWFGRFIMRCAIAWCMVRLTKAFFMWYIEFQWSMEHYRATNMWRIEIGQWAFGMLVVFFAYRWAKSAIQSVSGQGPTQKEEEGNEAEASSFPSYNNIPTQVRKFY